MAEEILNAESSISLPPFQKMSKTHPCAHSVSFPPSLLVTFIPMNGSTDKEGHRNLQQDKYSQNSKK